jgi:hypothetical protein
MKIIFCKALFLSIISLGMIVLDTLLLFPKSTLINYLNQVGGLAADLAGDFFLFFGSQFILFILFFVSAMLLNRWKFYVLGWVYFYAIISTFITWFFVIIEIHDAQLILFIGKYLYYLMPATGIMIAHILRKPRVQIEPIKG